MKFIGLIITLLFLSMSAGCTSPCTAMSEQAKECGTPVSVSEPGYSVCLDTSNELGEDEFETFSECVLDSKCSEEGAVSVCIVETDTTLEENPCLVYRLWASACGLEPLGTENDCENLGASFAELDFQLWVECVTRDGCPERDDERYDECQSIIAPEGIGDRVDACRMVTEWSAECEASEEYFMEISESDFFICLGESQAFTAESYLAYAECVTALPCDETGGRMDCFLQNLQTIDPDAALEACTKIDEYGQFCGVDVGGESVEGCQNLFGSVSIESLDAYVDCLYDKDCEDQSGQAGCLTLIEPI